LLSKTEIFDAMREYIELFTQVVAEFDIAANPNAKLSMRKRPKQIFIVIKEGVSSPGHLWGYAIIQFARRVQRYQDQVKGRQERVIGRAPGGGGGGEKD